jgi:hypothetical protein
MPRPGGTRGDTRVDHDTCHPLPSAWSPPCAKTFAYFAWETIWTLKHRIIKNKSWIMTKIDFESLWKNPSVIGDRTIIINPSLFNILLYMLSFYKIPIEIWIYFTLVNLDSFEVDTMILKLGSLFACTNTKVD